jgi:hypothetical protein
MRSLRGMPTYKTMLKRLSIPKMTQADFAEEPPVFEDE